MSIETALARLEKKVDQLLSQKPKPSWVKASTILELTGWTAYKLRDARKQETIRFKSEKGGYYYDLNSIHPYLIKK